MLYRVLIIIRVVNIHPTFLDFQKMLVFKEEIMQRFYGKFEVN
jgi:hypothetical protein